MTDTVETQAAENQASQTTQENQEQTTQNGAAQVVNGKEFKFFFKTETIKDEDGKEIGKGKKHPDVKAVLPVPTREEIVNALAETEGKAGKLIMELVEEAVASAARVQIAEIREARKNPETKELGEFKATDFDLSKLTLEAIANMPKGQRGAWAPSDEDHKEFAELYKNVLVNRVNYDPKKTVTHTEHYKAGLTKVKTNKPVLSKLKEFLTLFAANVEEEEMEEVQQTYDWLVAKIDKYMKADETALLQAL